MQKWEGGWQRKRGEEGGREMRKNEQEKGGAGGRGGGVGNERKFPNFRTVNPRYAGCDPRAGTWCAL